MDSIPEIIPPSQASIEDMETYVANLKGVNPKTLNKKQSTPDIRKKPIKMKSPSRSQEYPRSKNPFIYPQASTPSPAMNGPYISAPFTQVELSPLGSPQISPLNSPQRSPTISRVSKPRQPVEILTEPFIPITSSPVNFNFGYNPFMQNTVDNLSPKKLILDPIDHRYPAPPPFSLDETNPSSPLLNPF